MDEGLITRQELILTAAVYAVRSGVVDYIRQNGKLAERIDTGYENSGNLLKAITHHFSPDDISETDLGKPRFVSLRLNCTKG